jgi:PAS domain S-box-containing protein
LKQLEHEYSLKEELDSTWAVRPLAMVRHSDRTVLVSEDPGGVPLDQLLSQPLDLAPSLRLAIGLSIAINHMHRRKMIHKDIKPANVLVNSVTGQCWLRGFGIASRVPRERQSAEPPESVAGTLAYMAPEQTGRMNRSIDSRSDLYSLGVSLYEMLTGSLPFTACDPMEWVHCHIARQPIPPQERWKNLPAPVSAIIMKLLAKTAEERYQTAAGVESDLRRCLVEWETQSRIDQFALGEHDTSDRLLVPEKLYGRGREIDTLLASFDRVLASGRPELVLVTGYSGIGKSSVVNEVHKGLVPSRGLFASGKFDQYKRDIPYASLAQAFQSLVRSLLGQSEAELGQWRDAFRQALGTNGQLMVNLIPELELVIGKQPPVANLPAQDAQNRFQAAFVRFLCVFARAEHPLALFLDDLQWLDTATLELLERLLTEPDVHHLLLIGAYRDNEVIPSHPLLRTVAKIRRAGVAVEEIVLVPLSIDDVDQLVLDSLHCEPDRARSLAQLMQEKTGGNPFFAIQFFSALAEEGLVAFDPVSAAWQWNIDHIRAKSYTDNVVDLMAGKLRRFSAPIRQALKHLACLGNLAEIATLSLILGETEETVHAALWEAVQAGLVFRKESAYRFLHDRIQQAAYTLFPEEDRAEVHLRIGRVLLASMATEELSEHLFEVANQFNRGNAQLVDQGEKVQVATINLRAGRKAKASAAYASAAAYFAAGMALLDEREFDRQYKLTFSLWLERAECEFLTGNFNQAEQLMVELLERAVSKVDQAAAYHLKVELHTVKGEYPQAVASALTCLHLFGIDIPAHPTWEQVRAEYELIWRNLEGRPIERLIELPLITDPELQAAMRVLSAINPPAYFTDFHLCCLLRCRMVNISMQHGTSGDCAYGYASFGFILGPVFHRYGEGYRFTKLACDFVEKHGFVVYQARMYVLMGGVALWTQPITAAVDFMRAAFRVATETGDLTHACYSMWQSIAYLLQRNDPLDLVWSESERSLDFVRRVRFRDVADIIVSQQRFVATMQGRAATFSTFSDDQFNEATFEAQLTSDRMPVMVFFYWIFKLKARFLSGDYADALAAAEKAKELLWGAFGEIMLLDYFYYTALTVAALVEKTSADEQIGWRELLTAHCEQLREWTDNYPPTFADKHALVSAEIARLEGRELDAMRLYEEAIRAARDNGFIQNEGIGNELAARSYLERGYEMIGHSYLREARYCYLRWGALGKVQQLDQRYPAISEPASGRPSTTIDTSVERLDLGMMMKASQAIAGEIVLEKLIETLMVIAVEHAGAERGLLILLRGDEPQIEAEAMTDRGRVEVALRQAAVTPSELPKSALHYVIRTQESVILDDAASQTLFSEDAYVRQRRPRSVLCLPLVKQTKLIGVLYLENRLAPRVFTPTRIAALKLLASQAAISLENTRLYRDLEEREAKIRRLVEANIIGIFIWNLEGEIIEANEAFLQMEKYSREDIVSGRLRWTNLTPPEWRDGDERAVSELKAKGTFQPLQKEFFRKDGSRVPVLIGGAIFEGSNNEGVAFVLDLSEQKRAEDERKRAEEELLQKEVSLREAQTELAHVSRVTTMGELAASIAHEVNQPLAGIVTNANASLRWLAGDSPNLAEAREAIRRILRDGNRAGDVVSRMRALLKKASTTKERLDINQAIQEVVVLTQSEVQKNRVTLRMNLAANLPPVMGDRVQIQQVALNLMLNAIEAMRMVEEHERDLVISTQSEGDEIRVVVRDAGIGFDPLSVDRIFDAFHTTKPGGLGMGLSISRSIVESHGGRLWASPNQGRGVTFQFSLLKSP